MLKIIYRYIKYPKNVETSIIPKVILNNIFLRKDFHYGFINKLSTSY